MTILDFYVDNMEINSTLIKGLEVRAEINSFLADAKLFSNLVPVGINRTGGYPDYLGNFLGCLAFI